MATREPIPANVLQKVRRVLELIRIREEGLRALRKSETPPLIKKEPPKGT